MRAAVALVVLCAVLLGYLSQLDLRLTAADLSHAPTSAAVVKFYDMFGAILMNDLYHHTFEARAMFDMVDHCGFHGGQIVLEVGPGSGFLADQILARVPDLFYVGVDSSKSLQRKATQRLKPYIDGGTAEVHFANDSFAFLEEWDSPVDRYIFTYVLDLLPKTDIDRFARLLRSKLQSRRSSKICIVNLTYGYTPLSRMVTNSWQLLYRYLGGAAVGGCRPLQIADYFRPEEGYRLDYLSRVVSTGLPSEVAVLSAR
jgi:phospholipid N-methyltransferase